MGSAPGAGNFPGDFGGGFPGDDGALDDGALGDGSALPSRASHDSQEMGRRWPMGMIFVPSQGGLSHSAAEFTSSRQCSDGTAVLMQSLVRLDQRLNKVPG